MMINFTKSWLFIAICFSLTMQAQLPHQLSTDELSIMEFYNPPGSLQGIPSPPGFEVRTPAEWEEAEAIMIAWTGFPAVLREIVRESQNEMRVIIICDSEETVTNYLNQGGVFTNNVEFVIDNFNSIWCRDYGQWNVYREDVGELNLVDWIYNRPRPADDQVPQVIADYFELEMYETTEAPYDLVHTGGNFMTDGLGTGFSSSLITEENPDKTESEIDQIMNEFMGINRYIKMPTLPFDEIHHIDMHMKLIDEETIVVSQYPQGVADGPQIEANIDEVVANYQSYFGDDYRIVPMVAPAAANGNYPDQNGHYRTYTNSVFVNKTLLVPIYDTETDNEALNIYRSLLPGYNVVGIDCNQIIPSLGALHCITKLVHHDDPLLIVHQQKRESLNEETYRIEARIQHDTDIASAFIFYRSTANDVFTTQQMSILDFENNIWFADLPLHFNGTQLDYFIQANSISGKSQVRPITAPQGYYSFNVMNEINDSTDLPNTGIEIWAELIEIDLFPNPSSELLFVEWNSQEMDVQEISINDLSGKEVKLISNLSLNLVNSEKLQIDVSEFASGIYFLNMRSAEGALSRKFVVE